MSGTDPIVVMIELAAAPARVYAAFTAGFADWWPAATHSLSRQAGTRCRLDATPGGALEERAPGGERHQWGTIESVEPGRQLRFSWHPGREAESAQWVELRFDASGPGCRLTLTHGGWESLGEIAPILRREYASGWQAVLGDCFAEFVAQRA
jgi:uncharacterized protein YndB with AHSA1/START domain